MNCPETRPSPSAPTETLDEAIAAFLRSREIANATAATLRTYAADLKAGSPGPPVWRTSGYL